MNIHSDVWIQVSDGMKVTVINGCPAVHVGNNIYVPKCPK